ncbi:hypothetical protein DPMN_079856 [Dreissena polymorpha]|uniref:Uncharacterized protein n=1 Tax=Dreissena polymorpha TaxID=45954 RepID=A0A9D3YTW5_DREPO|nr:hypothetical protein DPMN_079856 [Dreissena polymorpha]
MLDKKNVLRFSIIGVSALEVLCCILALSLNDWTIINIRSLSFNIDTNSGLWKYCVDDICNNFVIVTDWLNAVRALAFLGLFSSVGSIVTFVLYNFILEEKKLILYLTFALAVASGLFMLIAFIVYVTCETKDAYLGAGFGLCIVASILGWIATGLLGTYMKMP